MDSELAGWTNPVQRLKGAIENNEFELYCQPILQVTRSEREPLAGALVRLREEAVERFAAMMKPVGTPLLIDGFGSRAVSFTPLKALGVQFVKVDGRITRKVISNDSARSKLNAILRVGERLGFGVVAECVEEQ